MEIEIPIMTKEDYNILSNAKSKLENLGLIMQGLNIVGNQLEKGIKLIPKKQLNWISGKVNNVLIAIIEANLRTLSKGKIKTSPSNKTYKAAVFASGFGFGFLGAFGFAADLMLSTKFMMRSIMDIARSKGEDINEIETQLSCLQVFALGGNSKDDDGIETSYYGTRIALSSAIKMASMYVAENGIAKILEKMALGSPLMKVISKIASRYEVAAVEKFAVEGIPIAGAVGGATINWIFINHFQRIAEAHFTVRQLERKYGAEFIQEKYNEIKVN